MHQIWSKGRCGMECGEIIQRTIPPEWESLYTGVISVQGIDYSVVSLRIPWFISQVTITVLEIPSNRKNDKWIVLSQSYSTNNKNYQKVMGIC